MDTFLIIKGPSMKILISFAFVVLMISCSAKSSTTGQHAPPGDTVKLHSATGFMIIRHPGYQQLVVQNPWQLSNVLARYYLVTNDTVATPTNGIKIKVPAQRIAISSSTHVGFLDILHQLPAVVGASSPELIYSSYLQERFRLGEIISLGDAFNIHVEKTLQLQPEWLMMSGYNQNDPYSKRVMQAGIPVIYNNEWMEHTLLGRAEWIRFVAAFFDQDAQADSIFYHIVEAYESVRLLAQSAVRKPAVMSGANFRGTWYMPGGGSFMAELFRDAGGSYHYATDTTRGSLPLHLETVVRDFAAADVWLNCSYSTMDDLLEADRKHALFQPVTTNKVYNFNRRMLPSTANDFWESAVARPDLLLRDVIHLLHPELLPGHELIYAAPLR